MFASGWSVTLLLFRLLGSVTTSPVPRYTPAPPLPLQISPPTGSQTILPSLPSSSPTPYFSTPGESDKSDACPLMMSPSSLVVRFEDPVTANCSVTAMGFFMLGWEVSLAKPEPTVGHFLVWSVDKMTEWSIKPACFVLADQGGHCQRNLSLVVYKPPDSVSISLFNHTGPMLEGKQYTLQCAVHGVAPVENLTVTFYRENTALGQLRSTNKTKQPVTELFSLDISPIKDDDRCQYWCEAKLELGPERPPVVRSQKLSATVYFSPQLTCPTTLRVREGETLSCEVKGNPPPLVTWFRDGKEVALPTHSSREHAGKYTVSTKGSFGERNFTVEVEVEVLPGSGAANNCNRYFLLAVLLIQVIPWL